MTMTNLQQVLEKIRAEKYQHLDRGVVEQIVKIQTDFLDSASDSYSRINRLVDDHLRAKRGSDATT